MKMRDLEAKTGVNRETIRVYFREGLLPEPARPARNVADYGEEHVRAITAIRKLQRDSAFTLADIRSMLNGEKTARHVGATTLSHLEQLVASRVGVESGLMLLSALAEQNPYAETDAAALARIGVVELIDTDEGPALSLTDTGLVNIWARMRQVGFDEAHGFPPEIVDYYVTAAEFVADHEAGIFLEKVEGKLGQDEAASMLEFALPSMLTFFGIIRQKAFLRFIGDRTNPDRQRRNGQTLTRKPRVQPARGAPGS